MKKTLMFTAVVCLTSLLSLEAKANMAVHFTNSSGIKGQLWAEIGECSTGAVNVWVSPWMGNGTASGNLSCPIQSTSGNYGYYIFFTEHSSNKCQLSYSNDVDTVLKNGYTAVYVTVNPGRPCEITRTFQ